MLQFGVERVVVRTAAPIAVDVGGKVREGLARGDRMGVARIDDKPRWGPDGRILYFVSNRASVANVWGRRFDDSSGMPIGDPFPVTSRSPQVVLTARTVQMDIAVTATHLLLPLTEARSEIWMLDQVDR